jgi:predicted DsbA family dithiol-disulfide isomerase
MIIDAVYDFLCPWCFVGKRHLDLAIAQEAPADLQIRYRPFMLYPHFDRGGHDFLEFFRQKYGETLRVPMWDKVRAVAKPIGIDFQFERMTRGPASLDGHRIVRFAGRQVAGSEGALIEAITRAFYEEARVIDDDLLVEKAVGVGVDEAAARAYLASDADIDDLFRETDEWRARGVTSMPHYILDDEQGTVEVVQQTSIEAFAAIFRRAAQRAPQRMAAST